MSGRNQPEADRRLTSCKIINKVKNINHNELKNLKLISFEGNNLSLKSRCQWYYFIIPYSLVGKISYFYPM